MRCSSERSSGAPGLRYPLVNTGEAPDRLRARRYVRNVPRRRVCAMRQDQGVHDLAGEKPQVNGTTQKRLAGKVAVVTGSSRGIGKAIARALGAEGAIVGVHYCRGREQADEL